MERCISKTGRIWFDKPENLGYSIKLSNGAGGCGLPVPVSVSKLNTEGK